jgi:hypothetical protein
MRRKVRTAATRRPGRRAGDGGSGSLPGMPLRSLLLAFALATLAAAPAQADITVSNVSAKPANVKAGASSDFTLAFDLGGSETIRDLDVNLPPGLIGNPNNAAQCKQADFDNDACPPASKVGTQTVNVTVAGLVPMELSGEVFNLVPPPEKHEPAQLGIKLNAPPPAPPQHLRSDVNVRPSDSGLTSTIRGIPDNLNGIGLHIDKISLTLAAKSGANKAFMTNPTSCDPATTALKAVGNGNGVATNQAAFTPTNCADLPFAPKLSATVGEKGLTGANTLPPLSSVITQEPGEANSKQAKVTLLTPLGPNTQAITNACPVAQYDADQCPDTSIAGHATAVTPLLPSPLTGPVRVVEVPGGLPKVVVYLNGLINVRLTGDIALTAAGTETTFAGIPDVPLSRFQLDFNGGPSGLVGTSKDLCDIAAGIKGEFLAHSGATKTETITPTVQGCSKSNPPPTTGKSPRPTGAASLSHLAGKSPTLKASAKRRSGGKRLSFVSVRLPSGLSFARAKLKAGLKKTKGASASLGGRRTLRLRSKSPTGLTSISATARKGALKISKKLRKRVRKHPKVKLTLRITEVGGRVTTLTKRVKLR